MIIPTHIILFPALIAVLAFTKALMLACMTREDAQIKIILPTVLKSPITHLPQNQEGEILQKIGEIR